MNTCLHSVQGTAEELVRDLDLDYADLRYTCAGINHMTSYLTLEKKTENGKYVDIYPDLLEAFESDNEYLNEYQAKLWLWCIW